MQTETDLNLNPEPQKRRPIAGLRWWIGGLLFASTVINYIDRQTLSVLAPYLKRDYNWTNQDYASVVFSFRLAYSIGQMVAGRLMDRIGTRRGLTITVIWYSIASMATSMASGLRSFCVFRFMLGAGESANWPAATKAVAEWFPKKERGWAVALFDSGSSIGGAIAPFLVLFLYHNFGGWRPAFILVGVLGFIWLIAWRIVYYPPEQHPRIGEHERQLLAAEKAETQSAEAEGTGQPKVSWLTLMRLPQTWGVIAARALTDPVWFFIADWFAILLVSKGVKLEEGLLAFWIPFIAADLGNFAGGGISSWLIRRGWSVGRSRRTVYVVGCIGVALLAATPFTSNVLAMAMLFGIATFTYAAASTMALVLPSDLFTNRAVATVSGMSGAAAGLITLAATKVVGYVADKYSFEPILLGASLVPVIGAILVLFLVRNPKNKPNELLKPI